jgi:hypothetical protein
MAHRTNIYLAGSLVVLAIAWRLINWRTMWAPNLELLTLATILAAVWLPSRYAVMVPLVAIICSDIIIGNSPILFFTWSAWAVIGAGSLLMKRFKNRPKLLVAIGFGGALTSSIFFFAYTNFGVWLIGGLYPHTLNGLTQSYIMGLPFYRTMIIGNAILIPAGLITSLALHTYAKQFDIHRIKSHS